MRPPPEIDVFRLPHSRMKHLMNEIIGRMAKTNFSNFFDLQSLIRLVDNNFRVFRSHERIENQHILDNLHTRITNHATPPPDEAEHDLKDDIHGDHRIEAMSHLINQLKEEDLRSPTECVRCGERLKRAIDDFAVDFFPHMEEEESILQPLLMQYFTRDELKQLKNDVLRLHNLPISSLSQEQLLLDQWNVVEREIRRQRAIASLPPEVWLRVFQFLGPKDLLRCGMVSKSWNAVSRDSSLWTNVCPKKWARGDWTFQIASMSEEEEAETEIASLELDWKKSDDEEEEKSGKILSEIRILDGLVKHLLPRVGWSVRKLDLSGSTALTNGYLRQILKHCPYLEYLDVSYTSVSDMGFRCLDTWSHGIPFVHVDVSMCQGITDRGLKHLASTLGKPSLGSSLSCSSCTCQKRKSRRSGQHLLSVLRLSGCCQITDEGLKFLACGIGLPALEQLDLSGCPNVSGNGLTELVDTCHSLNHEEFYYCDNITDGPFAETASGCKNVGSCSRNCCRSISL
ncbi:F-box/LRR-repeat protein 5-like [Oscarella lobularis]|uniref:F-box/LRR-repeat protein 5-like n=1 Tax=Oscarella lobularis TaxID=121494 RepID=UPI0033131067